VLFGGTPRSHKGVEDLIESLANIPGAYLCLVGLNKGNNYHKKLINIVEEKLGSERSLLFGTQPFSDLPEFLALSDIVVIPQRKSYSTVGQMPAKVFDAMAMAKPIITTNVSDLAKVVQGVGWVVEPEKPAELGKTIKYVLEHTGKAKEKGEAARNRFKKKFSYAAMESKLKETFSNYNQ